MPDLFETIYAQRAIRKFKPTKIPKNSFTWSKKLIFSPYNPVSWTVFLTAFNVFSNSAFSLSCNLNSNIFSMPLEPITVGTPIKYPSIPNSPSQYAAQGRTLFLSRKYDINRVLNL